ncbi:hypothetical protein [Virgibacillus alimentarius]|uniref:hypothetical protein n=1 Tax=Virgibacillus alimentarius TaxID=698769 RepID=UPI0004938D54|nr:hypothetical protein [Virgibacillus alimentarius]
MNQRGGTDWKNIYQPLREDINRKRTCINRCAGIATGKEHISTGVRGYQPEKNIYQPVRGDIDQKRTYINRCAGIATGKEHVSTGVRG